MEIPVDADTQTALDTFLSQACSSGQQAGQDAVRSAITGNKVTDISSDYNWRPDVFEKFPLYFFQAATEVTSSRVRDGTFLWHEKGLDTPENDRRHP
eukprot:2067366-Karenia_brevis.AAC.1